MIVSDPHSYSDPSQGMIQHIEFDLTFDFHSHRIDSIATYTLDKPVTGSFFLDTREIEVDQIRSNGRPLAWTFDASHDLLGDRLHLTDLQDTQRFTIHYTPAQNARALQWLTPEQTAGGKHPYLYSQCYALNARSIFPCQDSPSVRFTYSAELHVPHPLSIVMAAAPSASEESRAMRHYRFEMPQPIPSYLLAFAVGRIVSKDLGPRCCVYAEPEMVDDAAWEFAKVESYLDAAEGLFGPYLWDRYDILIMPPSFPYGGMENPRLTFISPRFIVGDRSLTGVIAHELAHAWTGNLVTNATWEDFWLNEGWTTYADYRIKEIINGRDFVDLTKAMDYNEVMMDIERFGIDSDPTRLKFSQEGVDPEAVFSSIPYIKGSFFIQCLEEAVGRKAFDAFIRKYISRYRFKSLTTEAFVDLLRHELPESTSKVPIQDWIYEPGYPSESPEFRSDLYDDVSAIHSAYREGTLPKKSDISNWITQQRMLFFQMLQDDVPIKDCRYFDDLFELGVCRIQVILMQYYSNAIRAGYKELLPRIEDFMEMTGGQYPLRRVMQSLVETDWSKDLARPLYERNRHRYHAITRSTLERILSEAGL
ncbi:MAG: M1 family peptidase [Anaerolineales bacterium]|nr:M1 family peptidase [Anaerolineales bacterium]